MLMNIFWAQKRAILLWQQEQKNDKRKLSINPSPTHICTIRYQRIGILCELTVFFFSNFQFQFQLHTIHKKTHLSSIYLCVSLFDYRTCIHIITNNMILMNSSSLSFERTTWEYIPYKTSIFITTKRNGIFCLSSNKEMKFMALHERQIKYKKNFLLQLILSIKSCFMNSMLNLMKKENNTMNVARCDFYSSNNLWFIRLLPLIYNFHYFLPIIILQALI